MAYLSADTDKSYGRLASFIALISCVIWQSYIVWAMCHVNQVSAKEIREAITDIPNNWLLVICIPYGISKGLDIAPAVLERLKSVFTKGEGNGIPNGG